MLDSAVVRAGDQVAGGAERVVVGGAVHVFRDARIARQARELGTVVSQKRQRVAWGRFTALLPPHD